MGAKTNKQVKDALVTVLRNMKTQNGYQTELSDNLVYGQYVRSVVDSKSDVHYPRCFVMYDLGQVERMVNAFEERQVFFILFFMAKKTNAASKSPTEQCEAFIDDLTKLLENNETLAGTVTTVELREWVTDAGVLDPEGVALVYLRTTRQARS